MLLPSMKGFKEEETIKFVQSQRALTVESAYNSATNISSFKNPNQIESSKYWYDDDPGILIKIMDLR